jgi:probable HAF family extracellular repeat protein
MLSRGLVRVAIALALVPLSCDEPDAVCEAGRTEACACPGGEEGTQQCAMDGSNWLECDCSEAQDPCRFVTCSGHGECSPVAGIPECACDEGFDGDDCSACADGFHRDGDACVADYSCDDLDCGDHGTCAVEDGIAGCACDDGWAGAACDACYPGYHDDGGDCVLDEVCRATSCAGHGECDDADGFVVCDCDEGFGAPSCAECQEGFHRDGENCVADETCEGRDCSGNGVCSVAGGISACACADGYTGTECETCYPGYHDEEGSCVLDETCLDSTCAGRGVCADDDGIVSCTCDDGYTGASCAECAGGYHREGEACVVDETCDGRTCSGHGTCLVTDGLASCSCEAGYTGGDCEACYEGYHDDGVGGCALDEVCLSGSCSGRGTCDDTGGVATCACYPGWGGGYCDERRASFTGLGDLPGGEYISRAWAVSGDGTVVVGHSDAAAGDTAFRWTAAGGMVSIGSSADSICWPRGVDQDGSTIVGYCPGAFRWTAASGMVALDGAPGDVSPGATDAVSSDGSVIVGMASGPDGSEAYRWTAATGAVGLGDLPGGTFRGRSHAVSSDGTVVVGWSQSASGTAEPFRWSTVSGMVGLGHPSVPPTWTTALGVSGDGLVVVGRSGTSDGQDAFRWSEGVGYELLGDLPGGRAYSIAYGASHDGSTIIGLTHSTLGYEAFIWDEMNGMRSLRDVLIADYGLGDSLAGWALGGYETFSPPDAATGALAITPDGQAIVGVGTNPDGNWEAWIATIPSE